MDWKIGEIAVCIKIGRIHNTTTKGSPPPLRLKSEYIIHNIYRCPKCKCVSLDVGLSSPNEEGEYLGTRCCTELIPCSEVHWCDARRFSKKKTKEKELTEAIENENYEKASQLRDELQ